MHKGKKVTIQAKIYHRNVHPLNSQSSLLIPFQSSWNRLYSIVRRELVFGRMWVGGEVHLVISINLNRFK